MDKSEEQLQNFINDYIQTFGRNPSEYILDFFKQQTQMKRPIINNYYCKGLKQVNKCIENDKPH